MKNGFASHGTCGTFSGICNLLCIFHEMPLLDSLELKCSRNNLLVVTSLQLYPANAPTSLRQRAVLIDEIWHLVGDRATNADWYAKRGLLGGWYNLSEVYMLTDLSPGTHDRRFDSVSVFIGQKFVD